MTTFIALLRGINILGRKIIRMAELKKSLEGLGLTRGQEAVPDRSTPSGKASQRRQKTLKFEKVETYLQSGNVLFSARQSDVKKLAAGIKGRVAKDFGFEVEVLVLPQKDMVRVANANPFSDADVKSLYVVFLFELVKKSEFDKLKLPLQSGERAVLVGQAVYLSLPNGYGKTKVNNNYFEKALGVSATTRNWNTVTALAGK